MTTDGQTSLFDGIDIQAVVASINRHHDNQLVLEEIWHDYMIKYPGYWLGVEDGVPTIAPKLKELLGLLDNPGTAAVRRLVEFRLIPRAVLIQGQ